MGSRHSKFNNRPKVEWHRPPAVVGAALLALAIAGCASTGKPQALTTLPTVVTTTSTTTVGQVDATVVGRWEAAEQASVAAAMNPGSQGALATLSDYFVDPELSFLLEQYNANVATGLKTIGTFGLGQPQVVSLTGSQAVVESCESDELTLVFGATGKPLGGGTVATTPTPAGVRATLVLSPDGLWRISDTGGKEGSCAGF